MGKVRFQLKLNSSLDTGLKKCTLDAQRWSSVPFLESLILGTICDGSIVHITYSSILEQVVSLTAIKVFSNCKKGIPEVQQVSGDGRLDSASSSDVVLQKILKKIILLTFRDKKKNLLAALIFVEVKFRETFVVDRDS